MNLIPPEQLNFDNASYIPGNIGNNCGTIPLSAFKNSKLFCIQTARGN